jgi:dipeptidyl aminopeptidase/acylaminoacyl peptidase
VKVFFERSDVNQRLRDGDEILCGGMLGDMTTLFAGRDDPSILSSAVPVTQLTFDETSDLAPTWSPDGRSIAFASNRGGSYAIWRMDAVEGDASAVPVTSGHNDRWPDWSPDGSRIVFVRWNSAVRASAGIFTVPPGGGSPTPLTDGGLVERMPRYSPDGATIAFDRSLPEGEQPGIQHIWTMTAAGELQGPLAVPATE